MVSQEISRAVISLKRYRGILTTQQLRTLKGQMLSGDLEGAKKGLSTLLAKAAKNKGGSHDVNRQQRRRLEREQNKSTTAPAPFAPAMSPVLQPPMIPKAFVEELTKSIEAGVGQQIEAARLEGWHQGCQYCMKVCYAAAVLAMAKKEGYRHKRNTDMLRLMDEHVCYTLSSDEIIEEAFEKGGVLIDFHEIFTNDRIREAPKK